jgi:hypothetical protein
VEIVVKRQAMAGDHFNNGESGPEKFLMKQGFGNVLEVGVAVNQSGMVGRRAGGNEGVHGGKASHGCVPQFRRLQSGGFGDFHQFEQPAIIGPFVREGVLVIFRLLIVSGSFGNELRNGIPAGSEEPAAPARKIFAEFSLGGDTLGAQSSVRSNGPIQSHSRVKSKLMRDFCGDSNLVFSSKSCNHGIAVFVLIKLMGCYQRKTCKIFANESVVVRGELIGLDPGVSAHQKVRDQAIPVSAARAIGLVDLSGQAGGCKGGGKEV